MIKIVSINVFYGHSDRATGVDVELESPEKAIEFLSYFYRDGANKLPDEHFNIYHYGKNKTAKLDLHFGYTNRGIYANYIIEFLQKHSNLFVLPENIKVTYTPDDAPNRFSEQYDTTIIIPIDHVGLTGLIKTDFLTEAQAVNAIRGAAVAEKLSSLIQTEVKVTVARKPNKETPGLQVQCESIEVARDLRRKLSELANKKDLDTSFRFENVPGVAGNAHPCFVIRPNKGQDLIKLLEVVFREEDKVDAKKDKDSGSQCSIQ